MIGIALPYSTVPDPGKAGRRILFVQALKSLGFSDADAIIRQAVVDVASILQMLPPQVQPAFEAFLQQNGLAAPAPAQPTAQPVMPHAGPAPVPPGSGQPAPRFPPVIR